MKVYLGSVDKYNFYNLFNVLDYKLEGNWDLALIRLNTEVYPEYMARHFIINYICLPEPDLLNFGEEMALVSGFGFIDEQAKTISMHLRKALVSMKPHSRLSCIELHNI